jgi:hypothetical protein
MKRYYLANIRPAWPIQRQEEVLDTHAPEWRQSAAVYRDVLPGKRRQAHSASDMENRADILRPTGRRGIETVTVASLTVIAVSQLDLVHVLARLDARRATLVALAEGLTIPPTGGAGVVQQACDVFAASIHRGRGDRHKGARVSAARREGNAKVACEAVRHLWSLPRSQISDKAVIAQAGVARGTVVKHLGDRTELLKKIEADANRAAANQARRKPSVSED